MNKVTKEVYLPHPDKLLPKLAQSMWEPCGNGVNLVGVGIGGYCLTKPPDKLCDAHVQIRILHVASGQKFIAEGWAFPDIFPAFKAIGEKGGPWKPSNFAGSRPHLSQMKGSELYRVSIRLLADNRRKKERVLMCLDGKTPCRPSGGLECGGCGG